MFRPSPPDPESKAVTDEVTRLFTEEQLDQASFDRMVERARALRDPAGAFQLLRFFAETEGLALPADLAAPMVLRPLSTVR